MRMMRTLDIPFTFTAPASFLVAPVEGVFASIKGVNFEDRPEPILPAFRNSRITKLTHK